MRPLQNLSLLRSVVGGLPAIPIDFIQDEPGWLTRRLPSRFSPPRSIDADLIEARAAETQALGPKALWNGYEAVRDYPWATSGSERSSDQVRSSASAGRLYAWLAAKRRASTIVEFGTAFGVSGMYWLAGLKRNATGRLLTFEPNETWAGIARGNLAAISEKFDLVVGTFEDNIARMLKPGERIDIAFIDAIHTSEFVFRQFAILLPLMRPGGLVLFDDIDFSDDMASCWQKLARDPRIVASATVDRRLGIIELGAA
jgi:predicted O-methyltransferase YrrM